MAVAAALVAALVGGVFSVAASQEEAAALGEAGRESRELAERKAAEEKRQFEERQLLTREGLDISRAGLRQKESQFRRGLEFQQEEAGLGRAERAGIRAREGKLLAFNNALGILNANQSLRDRLMRRLPAQR